jgi:regulator of replication initiation timing
LLDEYQQMSNSLSNELQEYRGEIEASIAKRKIEMQKIMEENGRLERENDVLQREIEEESKRLRS